MSLVFMSQWKSANITLDWATTKEATVLGVGRGEKERDNPASPKHLPTKRYKCTINYMKGQNEGSAIKTPEHLYLFLFV